MKEHLKEQFAGTLIAFIYKLYSSTFRYVYHRPEHPEVRKALSDLFDSGVHYGSNHIYAFWHQDLLTFLPCFGGAGTYAMVSASKDGTIMSTALEFFGHKTVRGSSNKRPIESTIKLIKLLKKGHKATIAVDGPRGPKHEIKEGVILVSQKSGRPIFPLKARPERCFVFKGAWDHMKLPMPFTKIHITIGDSGMYSKEELQKALDNL